MSKYTASFAMLLLLPFLFGHNSAFGAPTLDGFDGIGGNYARHLDYDAIDRLTSATSSQSGSETFRYDPLGNIRRYTLIPNATATAQGWFAFDPARPLASALAGTTHFTYYAASNRLKTAGGNTWHHDGRGNVDYIATPNGNQEFRFNLANELIEDLAGTTFAYDARGWRYRQDVTAGEDHNRYFVYDHAGRLIERIDNGEVTDFVYLGTMPITRIEGGTATYIHPDYQNTPILETDPSGQITRSPVYLAYGFTAQDGSYKGLDRAPGYAGSYPEYETGLNYMGARYQYGAIARFLSPDPAPLNPLHPVGLNRYAYASDSPARYTDPNGRESVGEMIDRGAEGCGAVSCAFYAVAHAAWTMTGAEPLSQVADKGWSNVSTGDKIGAAAAVASVVPVARIATAVRGGAQAVRVGQAGEAAVRAAVDIGEKSAIKVAGRTRIPDGLTNSVLSEVKNVQSLSFTSQLRDFSQFSQGKGLRFDLYVRPSTRISAPLKAAVGKREIYLNFIP